MKRTLFILLFLIAIAAAFSIVIFSPAFPKNYEQIICDDEPDPDQCKKIRKWYSDAIVPKTTGTSSSCCGEGDAYWVDQIDKITDKGVWATVTDTREIKDRVYKNGQKVFIPSDKLDDRFQGNPTTHNVVFLGTGYIYPEGPTRPSTPFVYCAFINFPG